MILEIDDDMVDTIMQGALVKDYVYLTADLKAYKKNPNHLHEDDAQAYAEVVKGIEILSKWYFVNGEFENAVKLARKKK
jgi:uncharacterized membrane protein